MAIKIAIITDLHFRNSLNDNCPERCGDLADVLLERTVRRLNNYIKPDITIITGDLIDNPESPENQDLLSVLNNIIKKIDSATIVIPGNHDIPANIFYQTVSIPENIIEMKGVKILPFVDLEMPGYNSHRKTEDLTRFRVARQGFSGHIVAIQHVPLFPPDADISPYNYTNAEEIISVMEETGVSLSISGHFHKGFTPFKKNGITYATIPAICEKPFKFCIVELSDDGSISFETQQLSLPEGLHISDCHLHTRLAYCNENMKIPRAVQIGENMGLQSIVFTEHSAHLYFDSNDNGTHKYYWEGINSSSVHDRTEDYFSLCEMYRNDFCFIGMEIDIDSTGKTVIKDDVKDRLEVKLGAVHYLGSINDQNKRESEFIALSHDLIKSGIDILAHPFRIFRRNRLNTPERLFEPIAWMLKENNVAAEINFHTDVPAIEFVKICLRHGVKFSFGSDAHNLAMIGEFHPHLTLFHQAGYDGDFSDILFSPSRKNGNKNIKG
jgi:histidinol phosphatase-like PHP family hydrolase/predicted phosphodiesterase